MADPDEPGAPTDEKIRRGVVRTITNGLVLLLALAVLGGWLSTGFYRLGLGEEAIILRLGEHHRTVRREGLNWHWPEPIEYGTVVNVSGVRTEIFGRRGGPGNGDQPLEDGLFIQTADKNIVSIIFDLQYTIDDAYAFAYSMGDPRAILYEAAHASVRKVIGGMTVDEVLTQRKAEIEVEARKALIETLADYARNAAGPPAFAIDRINLQEVQPPRAVREAFQEVSSAGQDSERSISRARGDAQVILERARAEAAELREGSEAFKDAKILRAQGEATRFIALHQEYARAPEVTRRRLYLEAMEDVLPSVEMVIVEPDTVGLVPLLLRGAGAAVPALPQAAAQEGSPPEESAP